MELIGWIGSVLLAACGLPQAIKSIKQGHSAGISFIFLILWLSGELFTIIYVVSKLDWPLVFNYSWNIIFISIILYYKIVGENE